MEEREALDVLALAPGASAAEVKEAYRDLVKVWHPDRLGSDLRLRQKAEEKLRRINEAYRLLQNGSSSAGVYENAVKPGQGMGSAQSPGACPGSAASGSWAAWIYAAVGASLGVLVATLIMAGGRVRTPKPPPAAGQYSLDSTETSAKAPVTIVEPGNTTAGRAKNGSVPGTGQADRSSAIGFRVRPLSDVESARLEAACSTQMQRGDSAYQACLKAQLGWMMNPSQQPDLRELSVAEHESIDLVCADAKLHGSESYNHCLAEQVASLAAEPSRPDLSKLKQDDREAAEGACRNAKFHEGPAAYDRCVARFVNALAGSR